MGIQIEVPYRGEEGSLVSEPGASRAGFRVVSPGYFATVRTPLLRGRDFEDRDDEDASPVAIVNETLARRAFSGGEAVGETLSIAFDGETIDAQVIGVSADTRSAGLAEAPRPAVFLPHPQMPFRGMAVVARTALGPASFAETIRRSVLSIDPSQPVMNVDALDAALSGTLAFERFYSLLLGLFAAVAVALAGTGIYGVFSYWVGQRRQEMGLRAVLGAGPSDIVRLVLSRGIAVTLSGMVLGLAAALVLSRGLAKSFQGVSGLDPLVVLACGLGLAGVALVACYLPARAAARVAPTEALRAE